MPGEITSVRLAATDAFREGRYKDCLDLIGETTKLRPSHPSLVKLEARAAAKLGDAESAVCAWRRLDESGALRGSDQLAFVRALFDAGQTGEGFRRVDVLRNDRELAAAVSLFAAPIHERLGHFAAALQLWQIAVAHGRRDTDLFKARLARARCWRSLGNDGLAIAELHALRALRPDAPEPAIELVESLREARQFETAQRVLEQAAAQFGDGVPFARLRAKSLNQMADEQTLLAFSHEIAAAAYGTPDKVAVLSLLLANRRGAFLLGETKAALRARWGAELSQETMETLLGAPGASVVPDAEARLSRLKRGTLAWVHAVADHASMLIDAGQAQGAEAKIDELRLVTADWPYFPPRHARLAEWLDVRRGAVRQAQYSWRTRRAFARSRDASGELTLVRAMSETPPPVVVFCQLRNEMPLIEAFLRHYRCLGVERFTLVDNGSDDGTFELLAAQPDVELFATGEDFRRARAGNHWMNPLIGRPEFASTLCIRVDADEHLVFPGYEQQSLATVWRFMQSEGAEALAGRMIDLFPDSLTQLDQSGGGLQSCRYFDPESTALPIAVCPYFRHSGGVRSRLLGGKFQSIGKVSGIRGGGSIEYLSASHTCSPAQVSSLGVALLHYKFYPGFLEKIDRILEEKQHAMASQEYAHYRSFASRLTERLPGPDSLLFEGSKTLEGAGICHAPPAWQAFIGRNGASTDDAARGVSVGHGTNNHPPPIWLHWAKDEVIGANWGDKLNPALASFLAERPALHWKEARELADDEPVYSMIGSHLARSRASSVIWGTGFLNSTDRVKAVPRSICAVRGPLTRAKLAEQGIAVPAVFGDGALLFPAMYPAARDPQWDLGIIQHIREAGVEKLPPLDSELRIKVIDISAGLTEVIDDIVRCRRIVSSSLHGIIASHAYGVPATWVKFSDRPKGDGFKFRDYWATAGRAEVEPVWIGPETTMEQLASLRSPIAAVPDMDALIDSCPFMSDDRKHAIHRLLAKSFRMSEIRGE